MRNHFKVADMGRRSVHGIILPSRSLWIFLVRSLPIGVTVKEPVSGVVAKDRKVLRRKSLSFRSKVNRQRERWRQSNGLIPRNPLMGVEDEAVCWWMFFAILK